MPLTSSRFQKPDHYKTQKRIWDLVNSERSTECPRKQAGVSKPGLSLGRESMERENKAKEEEAWGQDRASVGSTIWSLTWNILKSGHWVPHPPPPLFWWEGDGARLGAQWLVFLYPWFRKILMYPSSSEWTLNFPWKTDLHVIALRGWADNVVSRRGWKRIPPL